MGLIHCRNACTRLLASPILLMAVTIAVRLLCSYYLPQIKETVGFSRITHPDLDSLLGVENTNSHNNNDLPSSTTTAAYFSNTGEQIQSPSPVHFSTILVPTDSSAWREVVFYKHVLHHSEVPDYLATVAPWYATHIPVVCARQPWSIVWLSLCDGLTALLMAYMPGAFPLLLYAAFALNPLLIAPAVYESLMPFELLLVVFVLFATHHAENTLSRGYRSSCFVLALAAALTLGSHSIALPVALLFPVGTPRRTQAVLSAVLLSAAIGVYAVLYLLETEASMASASLYAPIDSGVMWYIRQVVLAPFARCLDVFYVELPAMVCLLVAMALPPPSSTAPSDQQPQKPHRTPLLYPNPRVFLLLFANGLSVILRPHVTITSIFMSALLFYVCLNPAAHKLVRSEAVWGIRGERVEVHSAYARARQMAPFCTLLLSVPTSMGLYAQYGLWETSNANWLFFCAVATMMGAVGFLAVWMITVVEDYTVRERNSEAADARKKDQ